MYLRRSRVLFMNLGSATESNSVCCVTAQPGTDSEKTRILVNCQVGVVEVNVPWPVGEIVHEVKSEAFKSLFGIEHSNGSINREGHETHPSSD